MKKTSKNKLIELAKSLLFENIAGPVVDKDYINNSRMGQYDTPGPDIKNDDLKEEEFELVEPVRADEVVNNTSLIKVTGYDQGDKSFIPDNKTELSGAIAHKFSNLGNNDLTKKQIAKIWSNFTKIIDEV